MLRLLYFCINNTFNQTNIRTGLCKSYTIKFEFQKAKYRYGCATKFSKFSVQCPEHVCINKTLFEPINKGLLSPQQA